jgi:hypothetical protein
VFRRLVSLVKEGQAVKLREADPTGAVKGALYGPPAAG